MEATKFPTDNLYKFLAIFGLVISILSFYYPYTLRDEMNNLNSEIEIDLNSIGNKLKMQQMRLSSIKEKLDSSNTKETNEYLLKLNDLEQSKLESYLIENTQLEKRNNLLLNKFNELDFWKSITYWALPVGIVMMSLGFILWYYQLQRYQDIIIKYEAEKIKKEIAKK